MAEIQFDDATGQMIRGRAVSMSAEGRANQYESYESKMRMVAEFPEAFVAELVEWMPLLSEQATVTIVGWFAHTHGLSFDESLYRLVNAGDAYWVEACQRYGRVQVLKARLKQESGRRNR